MPYWLCGLQGVLSLIAPSPVADLVHRAHNTQVLQTAVNQGVQKDHMAGQILHMGAGVMAETIPPCQMDADIRAAQLTV